MKDKITDSLKPPLNLVIMKDKITDSLKPPLTKRPFEVDYWKLNEMPRSSECFETKTSVLEFLR